MEAPLVALPPNILPVILYRAAWAEILHGLSVVEFLAVVRSDNNRLESSDFSSEITRGHTNIAPRPQ
jgi:hypothetical protein